MAGSTHVCGLVLAAGAGTRYGSPKGLARTSDGTPWVHLAIDMLLDGGCSDVIVLVGADATAVAALVGKRARVVHVPEWHTGLSATLRAGLAAAEGFDAVAVTPVDTPDATPAALRRVLDRACGKPGNGPLRAALAQATYDGTPGHPVLIGSAHFAGLTDTLAGDRGAGLYLRAHGALRAECGDLWSGADVDRPPARND